jgi:hypothetical protein
MTVSGKNKPPSFFEDHVLDPIATATGNRTKATPMLKKKAGFYLSRHLLERFNRQFHQMKLTGAPIENKSALLEVVITFALDDLEKGERSQLMASLESSLKE